MPIDYPSLLNSAQLEAVTTSAQHVRIIAGAGSGKTRVLTYRVAYLIDELHVDPAHILAVTFTNKAAQEMKERVGKLVSGAAQYLQVSTFHSFCAKFLRKEAHNIGYPPGFTIIDEQDQEKLIKDIAASMGYKKGDEVVKQAKSYIGRQKTRGHYPDDINLSHLSFENEKVCLDIYRAYEEEKMKELAFDFDDLILQTIAILENFEHVHERWMMQYSQILVDEFQDTNDVQYKLLNLLMRDSTALYVVGDPDQTIYTWRGANQGIILDFPKRFPDYQDIILNQNYRSTKNILDAANKLISHNKKRVPKDLFTAANEGPKVVAKRLGSAEAEASWVVSKICEIAAKGRGFDDQDFSHIAILYRSSYMTRPFEAELASNRVPYRVFGGLRFYERKEVKDVFAYFRLLLNEKDDIAFDRIVNVPKRGIGETTLAKIHQEATAAGISAYTYLKEIAPHSETIIPQKAIQQLSLLIAKMEETKKKLQDNLEAYSGILKDFIKDLGYYEFIAEDQSIDEDRAANVNALFDDITHYLEKNPDSTFDEYLQNIALLTSQDDMNGGNYVSLMTIHVAKGLEFDYVFLISVNEGAFPSARAQMESGRDGDEEERRLAYVAMTRAKKELFLSCNSGYSYVTDSHAVPSSYFEEAGLKLPSENLYHGLSSHYHQGNGFGGYSKWRRVYDDSHFGDGEPISPFEEKKPEPKPAPVEVNGITDWKVGDVVHHEAFGDGKVVQVVSANIIQIEFDAVGRKTMLANHKMLTRKHSEGGEA